MVICDHSRAPWAVPSFDLGGPRAGRFSHPCIGDWVWITFERQHPYGPIWTGFATPTRRKFYTYPQLSQTTPVALNEDGKPGGKPNDSDKEYLPKDGRPMTHGWQDRYGNMDIHSAVGFFPDEHKKAPPPADHDAVQKSKFDQQSSAPEVNDPDRKYMARVTKYGIMMVMSDQGYHWKNEGDLGEFDGKTKEDEEFESKRWKSLQKLLNEGEAKTSDGKNDARRWLSMTRYGSRIEIRDTGWAQQGPIQSKSREGEFGPKKILSKEMEADYRWIKIRTKGGMLWQAYDKGFHPDEDKFIKRKISEELGAKSEQEDEHWKDKDARWIRTVTRYGYKIVLDDRGSDDKDANKKEDPRGNGILIKGRRSPGVKKEKVKGNPRGFFWEFNENDESNHTMWGTPMGLTMEMNDRYQYVMVAASMGKSWSPKFKGLKENEFIGKPMMMKDPEHGSYHLKLDHDNEYLRLKTRGGRGPRAMNPSNESGVRKRDLQQGLECRDGQEGDGPWTEIVDSQHRGMWWSKDLKLGIWRAKKGKKMYEWFDEKNRQIVIYNNEERGTIDVYANGNVNVISDRDVNVMAKQNVNIKADAKICMQAGNTRLTIDEAGIHTNKNYYGRSVFAEIADLVVKIKPFTVGKEKVTSAEGSAGGGSPKPGGVSVTTIKPPQVPDKIEPEDRGKTYNEPFEECPKDEIEHPTK